MSNEGTTHAAVSDGTITVRDTEKQQQNVADLSRDVEHANNALSPIFDKEKEQNRLREINLIGEIGNQVADIARTQGKIAEEKALKDPKAIQAAKDALAEKGNLTPTNKQLVEQIRNTASASYGTGSDLQRAIQAATAITQGLTGGNIGQTLAGGSAPYLAHEISKYLPADQSLGANLMAHAVLGAVVGHFNGNATVGAISAFTAEAAAPAIIKAMGWDKDSLTEKQKQTVSALATLAAGLAGGLVGDSSSSAVAGAQAGKNAVENNSLSGLEGFGQGMISTGQATSTLGQFMAQNGATTAEIAQAQSDLAKGLGTGAPQPASELVKTWALLMSTAATMGTGTATGAGAMVTGGVISGTANVSTQLTVNGDKPFSYTDALIAIGAGALTQGKGPVLTGAISVGGAYVGSTIKGEDPTNAMIGAGFGSAIGSGTSAVVTDKLKPIVTDKAADILGNIAGSTSSEATGSAVQNIIDKEKSK
ncbi:VENN motif pre-toxin domain-containing protein [Yersinia frederiksenii]|uniref:VENN motif pre-toxin domain-containing protein n=1 Tax=Yersinia frederiksenii TaxID=29484 RepID=UPI003EB7CA04